MQLTAAVEDGFHHDFTATDAPTLSVLRRPFTSTDLFTYATAGTLLEHRNMASMSELTVVRALVQN